MTPGADREAIDILIGRFFALFDNRTATPDLTAIYELALPEAVIIRNPGAVPETYTLPSFIAPRARLLASGELRDFVEEELEARTDVIGHIAQRLSLYRKSGRTPGGAFTTRGVKTFQLVRTPDGWRISAMAWDDERPGLVLPDALGV